MGTLVERVCRIYQKIVICAAGDNVTLNQATNMIVSLIKRLPKNYKNFTRIPKELRDKIAEDNRKIGGWGEGFDPFYGAPVILMVLGNKEVPTHVYDGSLMMGNLMLAAHSLGLGSIWIHRAKEELEMDEYKELLKSLGVEGEWEGIGHCAIGYADGNLPAAAARKENRVFWAE